MERDAAQWNELLVSSAYQEVECTNNGYAARLDALLAYMTNISYAQ